MVLKEENHGRFLSRWAILGNVLGTESLEEGPCLLWRLEFQNSSRAESSLCCPCWGVVWAVVKQEARLSAPVTLRAVSLTHPIDLGCVAFLPVAG